MRCKIEGGIFLHKANSLQPPKEKEAQKKVITDHHLYSFSVCIYVLFGVLIQSIIQAHKENRRGNKNSSCLK